MKNFKSHFWYNKRQRNGIIFLIILIAILQGIYFFINSSSQNAENSDVSEIESFQHQIDSLKELQSKQPQTKIFPFNPNFITDFKGYQLGMSVEEIDKLLKFRKSGKYVNSPKEFQNITGVNDSLLTAISPYFKFPEWVHKKSSKKIYKSANNKDNSKKKIIIHHNINVVTVEQLKNIYGIGDKLAKRIIAYRELLQGFTYDDQLYEVYYLDKEVANRILEIYQVIQKPLIKKTNLNNASFKEILHLPYLDYELTKRICNYRDEIGKFSSLEELKKIDSFPVPKFKRIALYLTVD